MKCPKNVFLANFLYIDRMDKEGKLNIKSKDDINNIISQIEKDIDRYIQNVKSYEEKATELPNSDIGQFHMIAKYLFGGANYIKDSGFSVQVDENKTLQLRTKHNVNLELDTYPIIEHENEELLIQKQARNIYLENEDTIAHIGTSKPDIASEKILDYINTYLYANYTSYHVLSQREKDYLVNAIQTFSLKEHLNTFLFSGQKQLQEFSLVLNDESKENIISLIESDEGLNKSLMEIAFDKNAFLENINGNLNEEYKKDLIISTKLRFENFSNFVNRMKRFYNTSNNEEFISSILSSKELNLTFNYSPLSSDISFLYNQKTRDSQDTMYAKIISKKSELTEMLNQKQKVDVIPEKVVVDISKTKPIIEVFYDKEKIDYKKVSSQRADRGFFYNSNIADGRLKIIVSDEADNAPKGSSAEVLRSIAKNSINTISSTATVLSNKAQTVVPIMANSGTIEDIEEQEKIYTELCGVYEIKSSYIRLLSKAMRKIDRLDKLFKDTISIISSLIESKKTENITSHIEAFVKASLEYIKRNSELENLLDNINIFEAYKVSSRTFNSIVKEKNIMKDFSSSNGFEILARFLFKSNNSLLKEVSGVQAGMLASLIAGDKDTHIGITTRENLTEKKETMHFVDSSTYKQTIENVYKGEIEDGVLEKNLLSPKVIKEYLYKKAEADFTLQIYTVLRDNFISFVDSFRGTNSESKRNAKIITQNLEMTPKDFIYHSSRSGKSTKDDVVDFYIEYLRHNGSLLESTLKKMSDEQKTVFQTVLDSYQEFFINPYLLEKENTSKYNISSIYIPKSLYSLYGENKDIKAHFNFENSFPIINETLEPIRFSVETIFHREDWNFIKEPFKELISLTNTETKEIIDNFSSLGKKELINDAIHNNKKPVVASSRVSTSIFNLYDVVSSASKRDNKNDNFLILANSTSSTSKAVANINKKFLDDNNIKIILTSGNNVAVEVEKACSMNIQFALVSNYIPVARGLSLAKMDDMIITDSIDRPNDGIQFLARGMNPAKDITNSYIYMHNGGKNIELSVNYGSPLEDLESFFEDVENELEFAEDGTLLINDTSKSIEDIGMKLIFESKLCSVRPTYTDLINDELENGHVVYKGFMSGDLLDTKKTDIATPLELTESYEKIFENSQDSSNEIKKTVQFVS